MQVHIEFLDGNGLGPLALIHEEDVNAYGIIMEANAAWCGSMKVACMAEQFDLYVEAPGTVPLSNGGNLPLHHYCGRLEAKGVASSVSANIGEMFVAWYLGWRFNMPPPDVIHLKTCWQQQSPDFLMRLGPRLAGQLGVPLNVPDLWPVEVKTRCGRNVGSWRNEAYAQLQSFWQTSADGLFTCNGYGIAALFRRDINECFAQMVLYHP